MNDEETVPCRFCGEQTDFTNSKMCINCHGVLIRLEGFARSKTGRDFIALILARQGERDMRAALKLPLDGGYV